ncbi:hypothetical protein [Streptomyces sp. NPDC051576]|uniref:hypothetical protein n=1 Tax=Streptomyces sp. NPDC051576 TaxID=3155803 RepID=UPI003412EC12
MRAPRAVRDLEAGVASGRFPVADRTVAVAALGGSLLALIELRFTEPDLDGEEAASNLAEMLPRMLGAAPDEVHDVTRPPLPDLG